MGADKVHCNVSTSVSQLLDRKSWGQIIKKYFLEPRLNIARNKDQSQGTTLFLAISGQLSLVPPLLQNQGYCQIESIIWPLIPNSVPVL